MDRAGSALSSISLHDLTFKSWPWSGTTRYLDMPGLEPCWLSGPRGLPGVDTFPWLGCSSFGGLTPWCQTVSTCAYLPRQGYLINIVDKGRPAYDGRVSARWRLRQVYCNQSDFLYPSWKPKIRQLISKNNCPVKFSYASLTSRE